MNYTARSYIIYYGILIFCFFMATWANKWNNKKYIFWIALVLSFFMGNRHRLVGIDTNTYYRIIQSLTNINVANNYSDPGFYKIAYLIMKIKDDPYFPILIYSTISCFLVVYRLWDFRKYCSYNYSILRYITLFYFYSFNCMRQFFSMSIIFYATKFLEEKKYFKFILFVLIASYFHIAALTSIGYLALEKLRWKYLNKRDKNIINSMILLSPASISFVLFFTRNRVERYFSTTSTLNNYLSYILKIILLVAFIIIERNNKELNQEDSNQKMFLLYYSIGMILSGLGFIWAQFERIGYFYYMYSLTYVGMVAKSKKNKTIFRILILFITIRAFHLSLLTDTQGQMPYMFNWE